MANNNPREKATDYDMSGLANMFIWRAWGGAGMQVCGA